jgi:hypothetical protein
LETDLLGGQESHAFAHVNGIAEENAGVQQRLGCQRASAALQHILGERGEKKQDKRWGLKKKARNKRRKGVELKIYEGTQRRRRNKSRY